MKQDDEYRPIIYLVIVLLLFYCSSLFKIIPIYLFNIDVKTCGNLIFNCLRLFSNLITALILFILYRKDLIKDFTDFKKNFGKYTDIGIKYWMVGFILMMIINSIIVFFFLGSTATNESGVREIIFSTPFIAFIMTCILAPFIEEVIFRKAFKDVLKNKWLFILMSGIVFGSLHVIGSINSLYELLYILSYSSLGIAFSAIYYKTNNIYTSMFMHFIHNFLVLLLLLISKGVIV